MIMRQVLDYAVDLGIVETNVFSQVKVDGRRMFRRVKKKDSQSQVFSKEEIHGIEELVWRDYENPVHSRTHILAPLAVLFMIYTGVRVGEALAAQYSDISEDCKWIHT